jgi:hypothetical protein
MIFLEAPMPGDSLNVQIGDCLLVCDTAEDASVLRPVNRVLASGSTAAYSIAELEQMVVTLERYDPRTGRLRKA